MAISHEHGSAQFQDLDGLPLNKIGVSDGRLWLGHPVTGLASGDDARVRTDRVIAAATARHMLTIAPTRSGKGTSAIIPNLLTYPGSVFVIDPKGENAWVTAERRRALGQEVFILDPWAEVSKRYGAETSARFNPMAELDPTSPDFTDDLAGLADALIINQGKDPHWDDSARELVAGVIAFLIEDPEARPNASLGQVRQLLTLPRSQLIGLVNNAVARGGVAARKLSRFKEDTNEIMSIVSTAITQTAFLDNAALADAMSVSDFDFAKLSTGKVSVYLVLPADKLGPYGRWLRLLVTIAIRAIARAPRPQGKVLFLLDEFGTIGSLSAVEQAFGLMGGMGICLWPFVQDLNQLKRDYPDSWETFVANAEAVQAFSVKDNFSAEYLSRLLGVSTQEVISADTGNRRKLWRIVGGDPNYRAMTDRTFQRPLMFPDEIRAMRSDWQLLLYRGRPAVAALMPYYRSFAFNGLYRPLPGQTAKDAPSPFSLLPQRLTVRRALSWGVFALRATVVTVIMIASVWMWRNYGTLYDLSDNEQATIAAEMQVIVDESLKGPWKLEQFRLYPIPTHDARLYVNASFSRPFKAGRRRCVAVDVSWRRDLTLLPDASGNWYAPSGQLCAN